MRTIKQIAERSGIPARLLRGRLRTLIESRNAGGATRYSCPSGRTYWLIPVLVERLLVADRLPGGVGRKRTARKRGGA